MMMVVNLVALLIAPFPKASILPKAKEDQEGYVLKGVFCLIHSL